MQILSPASEFYCTAKIIAHREQRIGDNSMVQAYIFHLVSNMAWIGSCTAAPTASWTLSKININAHRESVTLCVMFYGFGERERERTALINIKRRIFNLIKLDHSSKDISLTCLELWLIIYRQCKGSC